MRRGREVYTGTDLYRHAMPRSKSTSVLNDRAQHLFKVLVERYIRDGHPVGSRTLSRDSGLELSPATVRNVMADLEELGLVQAPHTSAGRVPTVLGYRLFVDTLLKVRPLESSQVRLLEKTLSPEQDRDALVESASNLLSNVSHLAGMVTVPRHERDALRQVEFLPLSDDQVLVILVVNEREVQNRIIHTGRRYTAAELQQAANYLNAGFAGKNLSAVRESLLREMQDAREHLDALMRVVVDVADKAFAEEKPEEGLLVAGQTNLMGYGELADMQKLRDLFDAFTRKRDILHLLDQSLRADGVQIFIGEESGYEVLDECSVVAAPYQVDGQVVGVLGVVGPTRMAYERVIPLVDVTARLLSAALKPQH